MVGCALIRHNLHSAFAHKPPVHSQRRNPHVKRWACAALHGKSEAENNVGGNDKGKGRLKTRASAEGDSVTKLKSGRQLDGFATDQDGIDAFSLILSLELEAEFLVCRVRKGDAYSVKFEANALDHLLGGYNWFTS